MRKLSTMLAMVLLATAILCGVAAAETKINFWAGFSGPDKQGMEGIVTLFEEQNPDVDVEFYSVPWTELFTKFAASFGTDSGPDIMAMHATDIPHYSEPGMLSTLEDVAAELDISAEDYSANVWAGNTYNESQWGIPLDYHPMGVYKNVAAFEAAGLDPNMSFDSAEAFLDACRKV
jgi:multiple sugar transport system substrate-binding protein